MKTFKSALSIVILTAVIIIAMAFSNTKNENAKMTGSSDIELTAAGATFPYPLYSKLFYEYNKQTGVKVNYQSIGSGGGIKQLQSKTVDFGASDAPMSDEELQTSPGAIVHIPTCLGAVVVTYNLTGNPVLALTSDVVADIFLGKITKWNDKRIQGINPGVKLPDLAISIIHRSDGSGTTYIFSDYLSKVSDSWKNKPGTGKSLDWPVGIGAKGNEGVSGLVKQTPGSIGYVELIYAIQNKMPFAKLKNKSGNFVEASLKSVSASADVSIPADARVSLTNTDAKDGYPISSFTYILVYKDQKYGTRSESQAKSTIDLIWWMIHNCKQYAEPLNYSSLPVAALKIAEANLKSVMYGNKKLL
ncbi:MAG: phosphate ABC transporter substrate-binding protein PstS [Bacteroidia bacterium]|nr:phosphate ABC transporter substrate-binding protein PstS [Bacteroidia bacterium]